MLRLLDLVLPLRCIACGTQTAPAIAPVMAPRDVVSRGGAEQNPVNTATLAAGGLCASCWSGLHFITAPACVSCGYPFELDAGEGAVCGACHASPPAWDRARSLLAYDDASRRLVLGLKHGDRSDIGAVLGRRLARLVPADDRLSGALIVPVPLHRMRLIARRYNQSALLADALARATGLEHCPDMLFRQRRTPAQAGLSARGRRRNVAGAFALNPRHCLRISGARVILVDDVHTTGATLQACATTLKNAGALSVTAICLARAVRPGAHGA